MVERALMIGIQKLFSIFLVLKWLNIIGIMCDLYSCKVGSGSTHQMVKKQMYLQ